ncbi:MAG: Bacterial regulatory protein, luxR family [Bacteroidetes bacterium]|nr:Bacterial regulatory protein, luxR family [Bacteroidota bacterium]
MRSFDEWQKERDAMFQLHPCMVTDKMRQEWKLMQQQMAGLLDAKDFSITVIDLTSGLFIYHHSNHWSKLGIEKSLTVEQLRAITNAKTQHFLFETEQIAYEEMMALSPLKRTNFEVRFFLEFQESEKQSVYYQLVCKPYTFDNAGNPWLALITTHRLPAKHKPHEPQIRTFSHTPIVLKEKKVRKTTLTDFQSDILELAHDGYATKEIAVRLHSTEGTVKNTRKKIVTKLGVENMHESYELARILGLLHSHTPKS